MNFPHYTKIDLSGPWLVAFSPQAITQELTSWAAIQASELTAIPASVPGNFELDLLTAGLIDEPFFGDNLAKLRKIERYHVWYRRKFSMPSGPGNQWSIRFEGIECFARVYLNGKFIGECDNGLIEHEFLIDAKSLRSENELIVHIRPLMETAEKFDYCPGASSWVGRYESLHIRTAAHAFGWDIMPRAISPSIWRAVEIVGRPAERLRSVFLQNASVSAGEAMLMLHYDSHLVGGAEACEIEIEGRCGVSVFSVRAPLVFRAGRIEIRLANPILWWPRRRGAAALYAVSVRLTRAGVEVDRAEFKHGIRSVRLERTSSTNAQGDGEFCFWINGEKIFILGTNWVPADVYHSRDLARIPRMLQLVEEAGCNLIRCWGGNVYEHDRFFEICDEKGILVWQDVSLACAIYPQDAKFFDQVAREVRMVARRLREHACLALWAGDNECDIAHYWWSAGDPNQRALTRVIVPAALSEEDPGRIYLPSSPFIDRDAYAKGEQAAPETHLWGPRDNFKSDYYRQSLCHFASEIGYMGCPDPDSVAKFISAEKTWPPDEAEWQLHATAPLPGTGLFAQRVELMRNQVREQFAAHPQTLPEFACLSQCVQAEAMKFFIESFRYAKWRRTGIVWWNLIDGWPQFSDAVVDYFFRKKLSFDFVRRSQAAVCVMMREAHNWHHEVVACNDTRQAVELDYEIRDVEGESADVLLKGRQTIAADSVISIGKLPATAAQPRFFVITWKIGQEEGVNHYYAGRAPLDFRHYGRCLQKAGMGRDWFSSVIQEPAESALP